MICLCFSPSEAVALFVCFFSFLLSLNSTKFTRTKKLTAKLVKNIYLHKYICTHEPSVNINVLLRQQFSVFDYMALNVLMLLFFPFDFLSLACNSVNAIKRVESIMRMKKKVIHFDNNFAFAFRFHLLESMKRFSKNKLSSAMHCCY